MEVGSNEELARRLAAAYASNFIGLSGVDRTLKEFRETGREIGNYWTQLAERVQRDMISERRDALRPVTVLPAKPDRFGDN